MWVGVLMELVLLFMFTQMKPIIMAQYVIQNMILVKKGVSQRGCIRMIMGGIQCTMEKSIIYTIITEEINLLFEILNGMYIGIKAKADAEIMRQAFTTSYKLIPDLHTDCWPYRSYMTGSMG